MLLVLFSRVELLPGVGRLRRRHDAQGFTVEIDAHRALDQPRHVFGPRAVAPERLVQSPARRPGEIGGAVGDRLANADGERLPPSAQSAMCVSHTSILGQCCCRSFEFLFVQFYLLQ